MAWRGLWTTRGTFALFIALLAIITPLVRLIEVPPKTVVVQFEALPGEGLFSPVLRGEGSWSEGAIDPDRGMTNESYEVDVAETRATAEVRVDRENLRLTVTPDTDDLISVTVGEQTRLSDDATFDLPDQPGWLSNVWKASWIATAALVVIYALSRTTSRWRDRGESLAHMNHIRGGG